MIHVENVSFQYPGAKGDTLKNISFDVKAGEVFGFLGPSGAGKSTVQKILTGVLRGYSGSVRVFDREMKHRTRAYYERIGVDFEFPNFYGKFTALQNLTYFASLYASQTADPMALLARVGLERDANKKVSGYSKGMKMRLGFIRSLLNDPELLFLDEPTSGLDPTNARILKDMVLEQKARGKTVLLTTHNMHDAAELCDRVAFIVDGQVKAVDAPHALQKSTAETQVDYCITVDGSEREGRCLLAQLGDVEEFRQALEAGTVRSIHSKEQTLEDVFIALTGRGLK